MTKKIIRFLLVIIGVLNISITQAAPPASYNTQEDINDVRSDTKKIPSSFSEFEGEHIDLRTRQLIYQQTDLVIPGNGKLDLVVSRSHNKNAQSNYGQPNSIANWHLDVPMIWGNAFSGCDNPYPGYASMKWTYFYLAGGYYGWINGGTLFDNTWKQRDYYGLTLSIPGQSNKELLFAYVNGQLQDGKNGHGISYITTDNWRATCYQPPGASSASAFLVTAPDGTKYYIEKKAFTTDYSTWWEDAQYLCRYYCIAGADYDSVECTHWDDFGNCDEYFTYNRSWFFQGEWGRVYNNLWAPTFFKAAKVEDVHGNTLQYFYNEGLSNTNNQLYLTRITANDGREVSFAYDYYPNFWMAKFVHLLRSATTNDGRAVTYWYQWDSTPYAPPLLRTVWLPEGKFWQYSYVTGDDFIDKFVNGIRIAEVQNPNFGRVVYRYETESSDFYGGKAKGRTIYGNVRERDLWNAQWNTETSQMDEWKVGTWSFVSNQLTTTESINRTTLTDPKGYVQKYDFVRNRDSWRHGLIIKSSVEDPAEATPLQQEVNYDWQLRAELGENNAKDRLVSIKYQRALIKKNIARNGTNYITEYGMFDKYNNPRHIKETGNTVKTKQYTRETYLTYQNYDSLPTVIGSPPQYVIGLLKDTAVVGVGDMIPTMERYFWCPMLDISSGTKFITVPTGCVTIYGPTALSGNGVISRYYIPNGDLVAIDKYGVKTIFTYHPDGELHTTTDANQKVTTFENYHRGIPQQTVTPEYATTRNVLDSGVIEWEKDGRLNQTSYKYDGLSRVKEIDRPLNNIESYQYNQFDTTDTRGGRATKQFFNGLNQPTIKDDADYKSHRFDVTYYDEVGRLRFDSFPEEVWDNTVWNNGKYIYYDALNRKTSEEKYDADPSLDENTTIYYSYQSDGVGVWDEKSNYTKYYYASYGNPDEKYLVGILLPPDENNIQAEYEIERDPAGKVKKVTELVSGYVRENIYNSEQQLWKQINPETGTTEFIYDNAGNLKTKVTASGTAQATSTSYGYDGVNRLRSIDYPPATPDISMGYDGSGNLDFIDNGIAHWDYNYDANNNLTGELLLIDRKRFHVDYVYDGNDHLTQIKYPSGKIVDYAPTPRGLATQAMPYATYAEFHPTGQVAVLTYANGQNMWLGITPQKRVNTIGYATSGNPYAVSLSYGYDLNGNVENITDWVDPVYSRDMGYDKLNRLTWANGIWGQNAQIIGYTTVGNLWYKYIGGENLVYNYDPATNRLDTVTGTTNYTLSYDVYGNITATKNNKTFYYDDASNLRSASISSSTLYNYTYDGNNRLVRTVKDGKTLYSAYSKAGQKIMEYSPDEDWLKEYYYIGTTIIADRKLTNLSLTDTDMDGINDKDELENGLNLADATDRNADPDNDGLGAYDELRYGTDIYNSDTDGDGLDDGQEIRVYKTNPLSSDSDGDGMSDYEEILAGTDPNLNIPALMSIITNYLLSE